VYISTAIRIRESGLYRGTAMETGEVCTQAML
jgi:hypothetical protein